MGAGGVQTTPEGAGKLQPATLVWDELAFPPEGEQPANLSVNQAPRGHGRDGSQKIFQ